MGSPCIKWSSGRLFNKCNMQTIYQMITEQSLNYIHKIQITQTPNALYNMYKLSNRPQRSTITPELKPTYNPKTKFVKASLFFRFSKLYNDLPITLKTLPIIKFKLQIKSHIKTNHNSQSLP